MDDPRVLRCREDAVNVSTGKSYGNDYLKSALFAKSVSAPLMAFTRPSSLNDSVMVTDDPSYNNEIELEWWPEDLMIPE